MHKCIAVILFIGPLSWVPAVFAEGSTGIDQLINEAVQPLSNLLSGIIFFTVPVFDAQLPLVVLWLIAGAVFFTLYLDIPSKPATIIQKVAPGPPIEIATATPPIFPIPTVPETAVANA